MYACMHVAYLCMVLYVCIYVCMYVYMYVTLINKCPCMGFSESIHFDHIALRENNLYYTSLNTMNHHRWHLAVSPPLPLEKKLSQICSRRIWQFKQRWRDYFWVAFQRRNVTWVQIRSSPSVTKLCESIHFDHMVISSMVVEDLTAETKMTRLFLSRFPKEEHHVGLH
jgi:hypothetical protein